MRLHKYVAIFENVTLFIPYMCIIYVKSKICTYSKCRFHKFVLSSHWRNIYTEFTCFLFKYRDRNLT